MKNLFVLIVLAIALFACNKPSDTAQNVEGRSMSLESVLDANEAGNSNNSSTYKWSTEDHKIIKNARIGLRVKNIQESKKSIDESLKKFGAYYGNESFSNSDYEMAYNLSIRVPKANFEQLIAQIEVGKSEVLFKEVSATNVTEEYVDLETRLVNKRSYLQRYRELLKQAHSIKEILEIEEEIRGIEEEIESSQGRLNYLSNQVDLSTIDLNISMLKDYKFNPEEKPSFVERLKLSLANGWNGFVDLVLWIFRLWPFWFVAFVLIFLYRKWRKSRNTK